MIDVTVNERVLWPTELRRVVQEYGEPFDVEVQVYLLEETVAEKLRTLFQQTDMFERAGGAARIAHTEQAGSE